MRRRSWPVLTWGGIGALWALYSTILDAALEHEDYRNAWFIAAAFLTVTAILRRIGSCRIILAQGVLVVANPISSYHIPCGAVTNVYVSDAGGMRIEVRQGREISPFAFSGSLLDTFFRTSERATMEVSEWAGRCIKSPIVETRSRARACLSADIPLVLALTCVIGGVVGT